MRNFFLLGLLTGVAGLAVANNSVFGKKHQEQTTVSDQENGSVPGESSPGIDQEEQPIYIVGSILGDLAREYIFTKGESVYYPQHDGYKIFPVNECHAMLLKDKKRLDVRCAAAGSRQRDTAEQRIYDRLRSQESASGANNKGKQVEMNSAENANPRDKE